MGEETPGTPNQGRLNKGGGACTGKFNIPEEWKPLKSGEPHEKQVPVQARGQSWREDGRLSPTITHHLVTGVKAARSQDAAAPS